MGGRESMKNDCNRDEAACCIMKELFFKFFCELSSLIIHTNSVLLYVNVYKCNSLFSLTCHDGLMNFGVSGC